jgi:hypothetical protein
LETCKKPFRQMYDLVKRFVNSWESKSADHRFCAGVWKHVRKHI